MPGSTPARPPYFDSRHVRAYWEAVYHTSLHPDPGSGVTNNMLRPVCDARAPDFLNRFMHLAQTDAVTWALSRTPIEWKGSKVLDVGCGTGRWSRLLQERGVGVDLSPRAIEAAKTLVPAGEFFCRDLVAMEFPEGGFDLAPSATVLQHLPYAEQAEVIGRLRRFLKPGGYLVILENVRDRGAHMFARNFDEWARLVTDNGMTLRAVRGCQFFPLLRLEKFLRRPAAAPGGLTGSVRVAPGARIESTHRSRNVAKVMYRGLVLASLVASSFPAEVIARNVLPQSFAIHGAFVFAVDA